MQIDLRCRSRSTAWCRTAARLAVPPRRQRVLRDRRGPAARACARRRRDETITVYYHGKPRVAARPPWDGGFVWARDSLGSPWIATADQGTRRERLVAEQGHSGRRARQPARRDHRPRPDDRRLERPAAHARRRTPTARRPTSGSSPTRSTTTTIAVNAGHYAHFADTFAGERGHAHARLLAARLSPRRGAAAVPAGEADARSASSTGSARIPWYEDGYKLVETPHLGMEHQSAVAYGNRYQNGYLRPRLSRAPGSGSTGTSSSCTRRAHEWWGNNITTKDLADMWVHESFANYAGGPLHRVPVGEGGRREYIDRQPAATSANDRADRRPRTA